MYFSDEYISLLPGYTSVHTHKHPMLHLIASGENIETRISGQDLCAKQFIISENVEHEITLLPPKTIVLFIAPNTYLSEEVHNLLKGKDFCTCDALIPDFEGDEKQLAQKILSFWNIQVSKVQTPQDPRIAQIIEKFNCGQWLSKSVTDIAEALNVSTSRLEHVFKEETGINLKQFMLMNRLRNVYHLAVEGKSLTQAALDSGFNSSAHLSKTAYDMTGISISQVLQTMKKTADF